MSKLRLENELELRNFGDYLLKSRIVPEKYSRYYVGWVRRFLSQTPERAAAALEDRIAVFLDHLRYHVEPWQLDQAEKAVRLYFSNYLSSSAAEPAVAEIRPDASGHVREADVSAAVRELIRLRHYSRSTEQTYLSWLGRFFRYLAACGNCPAEGGFRITAVRQAGADGSPGARQGAASAGPRGRPWRGGPAGRTVPQIPQCRPGVVLAVRVPEPDTVRGPEGREGPAVACE